MADHFFVYGTLMQNIDSQMARFLSANGRLLGTGKMKGYLYDVGFYPAALHLPDTDSVVVGHIFELQNEDATFKILDEYEGAAYQREKVRITSELEEYECWVYLYQDAVDDLVLIASGNYIEYLSDPDSEHWKFIRAV